MKVGVLALQGDVREHLALLRSMGAAAVPVKGVEDLETVEGLVLPGGESTTIGFLLAEHDLIEPLRKRIGSGLPVLGTCAGAILLAREVLGGGEKEWPRIGSLGIVVRRNAYGRQADSFEDDVVVAGVGPVRAVFIRAPVIEAVDDGVEVLAEASGRPVVVRQGNAIASTFHPELAGEEGLHRLLLEAS